MIHPNEQRSILLIDGAIEDAELMEAEFLFSDVPAKIYFVADGEEAMAFLLQKGRYEGCPRVSMIFLDLNLAEAGGFELLILAKKDPILARIPIIILSKTVNGDVEKAYELQANCCVRKPESHAELVHFVEFIKLFWLDLMVLPVS